MILSLARRVALFPYAVREPAEAFSPGGAGTSVAVYAQLDPKAFRVTQLYLANGQIEPDLH